MPNEPMIATEMNSTGVSASWILRGLVLIALVFAALEVSAETASDGILIASGTVWENTDTAATDAYLNLSADELVDLVSPIALYPDDLLAIVLPAATYPLEIVQAARFLEKLQEDGELMPDEDWDESVVALINYPEVVTLLNEDLDWTWQLGQAVLNQQTDVLSAVEYFRGQAYAAGNLLSDERKVVEVIDDSIAIGTADPEVIYVPYYEPEEVVEIQNTSVYHYYDRPYPVYYYPYPAGYNFYSGWFWGVTSAFSISWHTNNLHLHHLDYYDHPYYGFQYSNHHYRLPTIAVDYNYYPQHSLRHHTANIWQSARHGVGARPARHHRRDTNHDDYRHSDFRGAHSLNRSRDHMRFNPRRDRQWDANPRNRSQPRNRSRSLPADGHQQAPQIALRGGANITMQTEPRRQRRTAPTGQRRSTLVSLQQRSQRGTQERRQNSEQRPQQMAQRDQRRTRTQRPAAARPPRAQQRSRGQRQERPRQRTLPRAEQRPRSQRPQRPREQIAQRTQRRPTTQRQERSQPSRRATAQRQQSQQRRQSQPHQQNRQQRTVARSQVAQTTHSTQRRGRMARRHH